MTTGLSSGLIVVRGRDTGDLVSALERHFSYWGFRRHVADRASLKAQRPSELREFVSIGGAGWNGVYVEHLPDLFEIGYALSKLWSSTPIIVSRAYTYGIWECKAYLDRDLLFKVGDDPDHELPWVGRPLDQESMPRVSQKLGNEQWRGFLEAVLAERATTQHLCEVLAIDPSVSFEDAYRAAPEHYYVWFRS